MTANNLACYYRRVGKLRSALLYLEKAYALELLHPAADLSQTHLNLCATLSQLGKHESALIVELDPDNFAEEVLQSDAVWIVEQVMWPKLMPPPPV